MALTEQVIEGRFKRFNTRICDLFEMCFKDEHSCAFNKLRKVFLQESNSTKRDLYTAAGLDWESGKRFRVSRETAERQGLTED